PIKNSYIGQLINSQIDLHSEYGGVVPEIASRHHLEVLPKLVDKLLSKSSLFYSDISYVAVTIGPGLKGCLLVGLSFAKGLSEALKVPLIAINHLEGHLLSYLLDYSDESIFPSICLLVSGGHSEIIQIND